MSASVVTFESNSLDLAAVLERLDARPYAGGWIARCPAHDDRHASLSIGMGDPGRLLLFCHSGCD
jgi:hypothetical protein